MISVSIFPKPYRTFPNSTRILKTHRNCASTSGLQSVSTAPWSNALVQLAVTFPTNVSPEAMNVRVNKEYVYNYDIS